MPFVSKIYAEPATEPVTLAELKRHLKIEIDETDYDTELNAQITAARKIAEKWTKRAIITQTWDIYFDAFNLCGEMNLPYPNLQSVSFVKYQDQSNTQQTLSTSNYVVDTVRVPGRIYPIYGGYWPSTLAIPKAVQVRAVCGYGTADSVPRDLKYGILAYAAHLFERRTPYEAGTIIQEVPELLGLLLGSETVTEF